MYIENSGITIVKKSGKIYAPIKVQGVIVLLFLGNGFKKGEVVIRGAKHKGGSQNNDGLFPVTAERLEYLSKWLLLSPSVNTVEAAKDIFKNSYMECEIEAALIISRKMRSRR